MIRVITTIILFVCTALSAQVSYQSDMQKGLALFNEGKNTEAFVVFEKLAATEKTNWLPNYYVALANTNEAFKTKDEATITALLTKAQAAQDAATALSKNNPELIVMQARIHTAWIAFNPMTYGPGLIFTVNDLYSDAVALAPNNPRVVLCKAEFDIKAAAYMGTDVASLCAEVNRAVGLFANFKPETPFSPNWGKDKAAESAKKCSGN